MKDRSEELFNWAKNLRPSYKAIFWTISLLSIIVAMIGTYVATTFCNNSINRQIFAWAIFGDIIPILFAIFWITAAIPAISIRHYTLRKARPKIYMLSSFLLIMFIAFASKQMKAHADLHERMFCGTTRSI